VVIDHAAQRRMSSRCGNTESVDATTAPLNAECRRLPRREHADGDDPDDG
jgi:hypothetical protein